MSDNIITIGEKEGSNELEATFHGGVVNISVANPRAGDTETGFGYTCYMSLTVDQAHRLGTFLLSLEPK